MALPIATGRTPEANGSRVPPCPTRLILVIFRNSEFVSSILGRNPTKENFICFNLKPDSVFRELRILSFRNELANFTCEIDDFNFYKDTIEVFNKENEINILVFDFSDLKDIPDEFIRYLLNLNKKILIISNPQLTFSTNLIFRTKRI